jgi:hypothetical protein
VKISDTSPEGRRRELWFLQGAATVGAGMIIVCAFLLHMVGVATGRSCCDFAVERAQAAAVRALRDRHKRKFFPLTGAKRAWITRERCCIDCSGIGHLVCGARVNCGDGTGCDTLLWKGRP